MRIAIQEKVICLGKTKHLSEKEIDKMIQEEPYITIREYIALINEIEAIKMSSYGE